MATPVEIDQQLESSPAGIITHVGAEAINNNLREWFETPYGSMADNPDWGHRLTPFQFQPTDDLTAILIEMSIVSTLPYDIPSVQLRGVRVVYSEIDLCRIILQHQYGLFTDDYDLLRTRNV